MDEKSCCFIGHRTITVTDKLVNLLSSTIENLIQSNNVVNFLFGSRSQFDDLCFSIVTELRSKYPQIKRIAYNTRCECVVLEANRIEQEKTISSVLHKEIRLKGFEESTTPNKMLVSGKASYIERNQIMIDASDFCIFYYDDKYAPPLKRISKKDVSGIWTSGNSGTKAAYKYALQKKKNIINIFQNC